LKKKCRCSGAWNEKGASQGMREQEFDGSSIAHFPAYSTEALERTKYLALFYVIFHGMLQGGE